MKLDVVAEGVETCEQVRFLRKMNCQRMQGFYFSPLVSAEQISAMSATSSPGWPAAWKGTSRRHALNPTRKRALPGAPINNETE